MRRARRFAGGMVAAIGFWVWVSPLPSGAAACPPDLLESARAYRDRLNAEGQAVRTSSADAPLGVEETVFFDLAAHACHKGPGQTYRVYGEPKCADPGGEGRITMDLPYRLFFRRALTLPELYSQPWKPGTDGVLRVEFEREQGGGRWVPVGRREVLDLGKKRGQGRR